MKTEYRLLWLAGLLWLALAGCARAPDPPVTPRHQAAPHAIPAPADTPASSSPALNPDPIPPPVAPAALRKGTRAGSLRVDGLDRTYLVHLPASYTGKRVVPLLILLHGMMSNGQEMEWDTGMSDTSERVGFIVVYPDALGSPTAWNVGPGMGPTSTADDDAFIRLLLDQMMQNYRIDPHRVYLAGHSSGAIMTNRLATEMPERFAAIGVVAGTIGSEVGKGRSVEITRPAAPVPVMMFHGTADRLIPYNGGPVLQFAAFSFKSVADSVDFWIRQNGCPATPQQEPSFAGKVVKATYSPCQDNADVVLYTINGAGHMWPGGYNSRRELDSVSRKIVASDLLWDFFLEHTR